MDQPLFSHAPKGSSKRAGSVVEATEADEQRLKDTYGKGSEELADEAEKGYDVEKMSARAKARAEARKQEEIQKAAVKEAESVSDEELMAEVGVEPIYTTTEAAEFFDRSNQWLYWGLRERVFTDEEGVPIDPDRIGDPSTGRRRFTLSIVKDILLSSYRRGNIEPDELTRILRRIRIAKAGGEWREREGWHRVQITKNRTRWVHPDKCEKVGGKWVIKQDVELEND